MTTIPELMKAVHQNSRNKGFWDAERNRGEMIALMHSELSEALEAVRKPCQDQHIPEFSSEVVEMADAVIRIFDYCEGFGLPLVEAIEAKAAYNESRPYRHGKAF